jgi:4-oxalomesaconate tautomerase
VICFSYRFRQAVDQSFAFIDNHAFEPISPKIAPAVMAPAGDQTSIKIRAVNTGARVVAKVRTPAGLVTYDGDAAIAGVPGTAAPVELQFMDVVGAVTGALLPTGNRVDEIDGLRVTCMDVAMPMVIARAEDFGLSGYESCAELDQNRAFYDRMEPIRIAAGRLMGMGEVHDCVTPKFGLLAPPRAGGTISARYFMPWKCHPSMAVTGSQCLAGCVLTPGTVAEGMGHIPDEKPARIVLEHASRQIDLLVDYTIDADGLALRSTGLVRTARKLAAGEVFIPARIWA